MDAQGDGLLDIGGPRGARYEAHRARQAAALGADPEFERWPVQYGWWLTRREGLLRKLGVRI
jgi:hypothetical protein